MKTSKFFYIKVLAVLLLLVAIVYGATATPTPTTEATTATATPTSTTEATTATATPTPTPTTTDDEPGSLWDEETIRFNGVDLIKKDIPEWLVNAIKEDDPVVVARTIVKKNPGDFKIRRIFDKDPTGFYCLWEGYIRKDGDHISVANGDIKINLEEPTVNLTIPDADELSFEFVETVIKLLWERDQKSFWTERYEHFVEVKEVPFPYEDERCICIDGKFLSIMPDTEEPDENGTTHKYADSLPRGFVWYSDETFYCVKAYNSMLHRWKWSPDVGEGWERTGVVPTLPSDMVIATAWSGTYCWYVVEEGDTVMMYETFEAGEEFGIRPVLEMKFKGVGIARPFVVHEGNEGGWETAYIAVPEKNSLWKIDRRGIYQAQVELLEVTEERIVAQDNGIIEVLAQHEEDGLYGSWVGDYVKMTSSELEFQESVTFEEKTKRVGTRGRMKIEDREIVIDFDDTEITLLT